jgi:hypothetical protein
MKKAQFARSQQRSIVLGMLSLILIIVILQLWLLTATMEAYLGGDRSIAIPAALASAGCFGLILGLLRYLKALD